jgi:thiamine-monophosphate kinase
MGARGRYFFLTLGLPAESAGKWLDDFLSGMARAARRFGLVLAGGDTTKYPLVVSSLTVLGEIERGKAVLRSGARSDDLICVSGRLGEAELGLRLVQTGAGSASSPQNNKRLHTRQSWVRLTKKHLYPEPRLALGAWLATKGLATSMIDTSDGLSTDMGHICEASGVGARVWSQKMPVAQIPPGLQRAGAGSAPTRSASSKASIPPKARLDPLELALHGGEDYELLFTVPKKLAERLPRELGGVPITVIGEITRSKQVLVVDERGRSRPLRPQGWDPFRSRRPR